MNEMSAGISRASPEPESLVPTSSPALASDYQCAVCLSLLLDPVVAPCGHDACFSCMLSWQRAQAKERLGLGFMQPRAYTCPICRDPLPLDELRVSCRFRDLLQATFPKQLEARLLEEGEKQREEEEEQRQKEEEAARLEYQRTLESGEGLLQPGSPRAHVHTAGYWGRVHQQLQHEADHPAADATAAMLVAEAAHEASVLRARSYSIPQNWLLMSQTTVWPVGTQITGAAAQPSHRGGWSLDLVPDLGSAQLQQPWGLVPDFTFQQHQQQSRQQQRQQQRAEVGAERTHAQQQQQQQHTGVGDEETHTQHHQRQRSQHLQEHVPFTTPGAGAPGSVLTRESDAGRAEPPRGAGAREAAMMMGSGESVQLQYAIRAAARRAREAAVMVASDESAQLQYAIQAAASRGSDRDGRSEERTRLHYALRAAASRGRQWQGGEAGPPAPGSGREMRSSPQLLVTPAAPSLMTLSATVSEGPYLRAMHPVLQPHQAYALPILSAAHQHGYHQQASLFQRSSGPHMMVQHTQPVVQMQVHHQQQQHFSRYDSISPAAAAAAAFHNQQQQHFSSNSSISPAAAAAAAFHNQQQQHFSSNSSISPAAAAAAAAFHNQQQQHFSSSSSISPAAAAAAAFHQQQQQQQHYVMVHPTALNSVMWDSVTHTEVNHPHPSDAARALHTLQTPGLASHGPHSHHPMLESMVSASALQDYVAGGLRGEDMAFGARHQQPSGCNHPTNHLSRTPFHPPTHPSTHHHTHLPTHSPTIPFTHPPPCALPSSPTPPSNLTASQHAAVPEVTLSPYPASSPPPGASTRAQLSRRGERPRSANTFLPSEDFFSPGPQGADHHSHPRHGQRAPCQDPHPSAPACLQGREGEFSLGRRSRAEFENEGSMSS